MSVIDNVFKILERQGKSKLELSKAIGVSQQSVSNWKAGLSQSYMKYLPRISAFLGVSVDELCGNTTTTLKIASNATFMDSANVYPIPVFSSCGAGIARTANAEILEYIPLYISDPVEAENTVLVRVSGDSMYPKIENGDMIQVLCQDSCDSGQIAVVRIGDECLVKRVVFGMGFVELQSINPMYPPMRFVGEEARKLSVEGIVRRIIKEV